MGIYGNLYFYKYNWKYGTKVDDYFTCEITRWVLNSRFIYILFDYNLYYSYSIVIVYITYSST